MEKEYLKLVIVGHLDHGKSTLIGRLLLNTNSLPREKIMEIKRISKELGKEAELAFLTDQLKEERQRCMTIDTTQSYFKTHKRNYVIIDAPGHVQFIKNMITGATQAEASVLIVDATEGIMEQTKRHAYIINMLGIGRVIAVFNKMDLVNYKEKRFKEIKTKLLKFLDKLEIKPLFIIPVSAKEDVNISERSSKMSWYKGSCLLKALDSFRLGIKTAEKPLRMPIQDIYEIEGKKIIVGRILSGEIIRGQEITLFPSLRQARINSIKVFGKFPKKAKAGENIGLILDEPSFAKRGEVIAQKENPPKPTNRFKGDIFWMSGEPLQINKTITLKCATQEVKCIAEKIEKRIDSSTLEIIEESANQLKLNEAGEVIFNTENPIVIEKFDFIEGLGRFVVERGYNLQGAGIITQIALS